MKTISVDGKVIPIFQKDGMMLLDNGIWTQTKDTLFCYRDLKYVLPKYRFAESTMYYDVENKPIIDKLPHCPICGHELYDKNYAMRVFETKRDLFHKYQRNIEWRPDVIIDEV